MRIERRVLGVVWCALTVALVGGCGSDKSSGSAGDLGGAGSGTLPAGIGGQSAETGGSGGGPAGVGGGSGGTDTPSGGGSGGTDAPSRGGSGGTDTPSGGSSSGGTDTPGGGGGSGGTDMPSGGGGSGGSDTPSGGGSSGGSSGLGGSDSGGVSGGGLAGAGGDPPTGSGGASAGAAGSAGSAVGGAPSGGAPSGGAGGNTAGAAGAAGDATASCLDSGGTVTTGTCCQTVGDFPNTCLDGACGCAPDYSHEVAVCACPPDQCFNGSVCRSTLLRTGYVLWQAPGGIVGAGPALELLEDGTLRLWRRTYPLSVRDTSSWELALSLTPEENDELIGLLVAVDDSDLPHDVPFSECYPRLYFEGPGDELIDLQYGGASALSPEFDAVYAWLSAYLAANAPSVGISPAVYCG